MQLRRPAAANHHAAWKASGVSFEQNGVVNCMYSGLTLLVVLVHWFLLAGMFVFSGTDQI